MPTAPGRSSPTEPSSFGPERLGGVEESERIRNEPDRRRGENRYEQADRPKQEIARFHERNCNGCSQARIGPVTV